MNPALRLVAVFLFAASAFAQSDPIVVSNGVLEITLDTEGALPIAWRALPDAEEAPKQDGALQLLDPGHAQEQGYYPLALLLDGMTVDRRSYRAERSEGSSAITAVFVSNADANGLVIRRTYTFEPGSHRFRLDVQFTNGGQGAVELGQDGKGPGLTLGPGLGYSQIARPDLYAERFLPPPAAPFVVTADGTTSIAAPSEMPFRVDLGNGPFEMVGMEASYTTAIVHADSEPFATAAVSLESENEVMTEEGPYVPHFAAWHAPATLAAGESRTYSYTVFGGPKRRELLEAGNLGMEDTLLNYLPGWLISLTNIVESILLAIYGVVGNWGLAIVLFAILFRIVSLPLSLFGARNQMLMKKKMRDLKPRIAEIKEKYAKNGDKKNEAILALYKENGINPFAHFKGCLPLMIQLPILIALVQMLLNSYDLVGESFLWIADLTRTDALFPLGFELPWLGGQFNLLPIIMFVSMVIVGRSMAKADPATPAAVVFVTPVLMTLLFYPFPAGCMLFWVTGTVIQVFEQKLVAARVSV